MENLRDIIDEIVSSYHGIRYDEKLKVYVMDMPFDNREIYEADEWIKKDIFEGMSDEIRSVEDFRNALIDMVYEGYEQVEGDLFEDLVSYVIEKIQDEIGNNGDDSFGNYNKIRNDVRDFIEVNVEMSYKNLISALMNNVRLNCFVALTNTNGEMNYDFGETGYNILKDNGKMISFNQFEKLHNSYKFLCGSQGVNLRTLYGELQNRMFGNYGDDGDGDGYTDDNFVSSLASEIQESYDGGAFVFLAELPIEKIAEIKWGGKNIVINKNCFCGIYDWVNGEGGTLEVDLKKNVVVKAGQYELYVDGEMGYSIDQCYGLTDRCWTYGRIDVMGGDYSGKIVESAGHINERNSDFVEDLESLNKLFARYIENIFTKCETKDDYLEVIKSVNKIMKNEIYDLYDYAMRHRNDIDAAYIEKLECVIDEFPVI